MPSSRLRPRLVAGLAAACLVPAALAACGSDSSSSSTAGAASGGTVHVGVLKIAPASVIDDTLAAYETRLRSVLGSRKVEFDVKDAQGNQSLIQSIARDLSRSDDDVIAVIGTPAVIAMAKLEKRRPIIAIAMGDPVGAGVAKSLDAPGTNVTGSIDFVAPPKLLGVIAKTTPAPKAIGTIYDPSNQNSQIWAKALKPAAGRYGMSVQEATIASSKDVNTAARSLVGKVDALLIGPDATVVSALPAVASPARASKVALYLAGGDVSTPGVLASLGPDYPSIGRRTADVTAKVITGANPARVPFARPAGLSPEVNAKTAAALKLTLPAELRRPG